MSPVIRPQLAIRQALREAGTGAILDDSRVTVMIVWTPHWRSGGMLAQLAFRGAMGGADGRRRAR
ncbi:MAG: hypothetical protein PHR35_16510 [Kiritimatiellae bacterium]|nr:hypothetical protein [Kiritimatiellia bacterium]